MSFFYLQELEESFNYGLFQPPSNGKAGKFLDEERRITESPFQGPIGYLEVNESHFRKFVLFVKIFKSRFFEFHLETFRSCFPPRCKKCNLQPLPHFPTCAVRSRQKGLSNCQRWSNTVSSSKKGAQRPFCECL